MYVDSEAKTFLILYPPFENSTPRNAISYIHTIWFISFDFFKVFSEVQEFHIEVTVKPGFIIQFNQAIGACGGNDVKTELYKIIEIDASRNAVNRVWYERTLHNGTTVSFDELPINTHHPYPELEDTNDEQMNKVVPKAQKLM